MCIVSWKSSARIFLIWRISFFYCQIFLIVNFVENIQALFSRCLCFIQINLLQKWCSIAHNCHSLSLFRLQLLMQGPYSPSLLDSSKGHLMCAIVNLSISRDKRYISFVKIIIEGLSCFLNLLDYIIPGGVNSLAVARLVIFVVNLPHFINYLHNINITSHT